MHKKQTGGSLMAIKGNSGAMCFIACGAYGNRRSDKKLVEEPFGMEV